MLSQDCLLLAQGKNWSCLFRFVAVALLHFPRLLHISSILCIKFRLVFPII